MPSTASEPLPHAAVAPSPLGPWTILALDLPGRRLIVSHDEQYGWVAIVVQVEEPVFAANGTGPGDALVELEQTLAQMGVRE